MIRNGIIGVAALILLGAPFSAAGQEIGYELSGIEARLASLDRNVAAAWQYPARLPDTEFLTPWLYVNQETEDPQPSLADRISALEEASRKQADEEARDREAAAKKPTHLWTGRVQMDYWAFPQTSPGANAFENGNADERVADRFLFRRLRIGIQGDIRDNMVYKMEVDFNNPNNPQLKDNFIGWEDLPVLQTLLIGNQKRPYGLDHINSTRFTIFLERPAIIEAFNQDSRRFGIQSWAYSEDLAYNWRYGAFMSQDMQNLGTVFATPFVGAYQGQAAGRLARTWWDEGSGGRTYAHAAIAGTVVSTDPTGQPSSTAQFQTRPEARTDTRWLNTGVILGANNYELLGLENVWNYGPLHVEGEYQHVWMHRIDQPDLNFSGGYVYVAWMLTGEHMAWDRQTGQLARMEPFTNFFRVRTTDDVVDGGWGAWQVAVRYSHADLTNLNIRGGISNEVTYSLIWYFNPHSKLIFNCITGTIRDHFPVDNQTAANFTILGTRLAVDF